MSRHFTQGDASNVTISSDAFEGGFFDDAINSLRVLRVAALGQSVLATPVGLARLWDIEPRTVGKAILSIRPMVTCEGSGYVRSLIVNPYVAVSDRASGCTSDLTVTLSMDWALPEGAISHWRGRGLSQKIRQAIFDRDGYICTYCKNVKGPFHIDHVIPVASGGGDDLGNLVVACAGCNLAKSAMTVEAFKAKAGLK